VLEEIK